MKQIISLRSLSISLLAVISFFYACTNKSGTTPPPPPNPCAGITITVSAATVNPTVGSNNGTITAIGSGSTGFTYNINGGAFQASGSFTGLAAGSYTIVAKDANGCTGSNSFTLTAPNPCAGVTITVTGTQVNPTTGNSNGSISATVSGGTGPYTFNINGGVFQASGNFSALAAGNYVIVGRDANGCTGSANFALVATNPCLGITITVNGTVTNPTSAGASDGSIAASAAGGTGPYTFNINGGTFQASGTFNNLSQGNYTIVGRDANGCTGTNSFTLTAPNPCLGVTITVANAVVNNTLCQSPASGSITVTPGGGTGPYTFRLNAGSFQSSNIFSNLVAGVYSVTARDVNGCTGSNNAIVGDLPAGPLFTDVRTLIQNNCVSCHNPGNPNGGMIFTVDCNIVANKSRIEARAVNGNPSPMPPTGLLPASERQKIINWINAGGRYTD